MAELIFQTSASWTIARFRSATLTDANLIERASAELTERIAKLPLRGMLLINFRGVEFVSSQVIGLLLTAKAHINKKSGTLMLCRVNPKIREALHITGLLNQFSISESETAVVGKREAVSTTGSPIDVAWLD